MESKETAPATHLSLLEMMFFYPVTLAWTAIAFNLWTQGTEKCFVEALPATAIAILFWRYPNTGQKLKSILRVGILISAAVFIIWTGFELYHMKLHFHKL